MFVRRLVEKASKKPGSNAEGLKASDVEPRLVFHYGIPSGCNKAACDPVQNILAVSTRDGRIKLFGKDNAQAVLESDEQVPSKFLEFIQNHGLLLNVNFNNNIEVWDIDKRLLCHTYVTKQEITSFTVMRHGLYMYVGDSAGNIAVLRFDVEKCCIVQTQYTIPSSASHASLGYSTDASNDIAVMCVMPQPTAESKRILIIFRDGFIVLWYIRESKSTFVTEGSVSQSTHHEVKHVTSACWTCPFGSKVAVGYSNGDILIWAIPTSHPEAELPPDSCNRTGPLSKLNIGFKSEKVPIASLKWSYTDAKTSRLTVMGAPDIASTNQLQVVLLNEYSESRMIKLGLNLTVPCIDMETVASTSEQSKHKQDFLFLIGKSGQIYLYDYSSIDKYLLQSQSRSPPSLPTEIMVKMPFVDSKFTVIKLFTNSPTGLISDEDYILFNKDLPSLLPWDTKSKDGSHSYSNHFFGFSKVRNLFISGHSDGAINFWDLSCPNPIQIFSLKQQSEEDFSLSGIPVTALDFNGDLGILVSGDQNGVVRIVKFKPEPYAAGNTFMSFQGSTKKGSNNIVDSIKVLKVSGLVLSLNISHNSKHLAVGSDQGYVSIVDTEGASLLYEKHIATEISPGIVSLQFKICSVQNFEKNVLMGATKDSSIIAIDRDMGNMLSTNLVRPKKPLKALHMQILDTRKSNFSNGPEMGRGSPVDDAIPKQQYVLLCSEKASYVYSLNHAIQGVKKVLYKKKFSSTLCCWASTFSNDSDIGLMLLFTCGKLEIRSLPELSLLKETSVRGFKYCIPKLNSLSDGAICSSLDGDLIMVNGDQELFIMSVSAHKENFRLLNFVSQVFDKDVIPSAEELISGSLVQKEKKKGLFGFKGSKQKPAPAVETEDSKESIEELASIFSVANFPCNLDDKDKVTEEDEDNLNIDDIDIGDLEEKPKEKNMLTAALNKQKLANKFQAFTGTLSSKLKQSKVKSEQIITREEQQNEEANAVDQIKKKYGFSASAESSARMAESKLQENLNKLEGINLKTAQMQDSARSFSAMAKELLRNT